MTETRVLDIRQHKARTPKKCSGCGQTIDKGEAYTKATGVVDGRFKSTSWHSDCHDNHVGYVQDRKRGE